MIGIGKELPRRTKIIGSIDSKAIRSDTLQELSETDFDGLRVVYDASKVKETVDFISKINSQRDKLASPISLMLDLATESRASVVNLKEIRELAFGQTIKLSPPNGKGDFQIQVKDWGSFFREDATIVFGYGNVTLKTLKVSPTAIDAEVIQGGQIYPDISVHVPTTKKDPTFSDLPTQDLKVFIEAGVDYLVIPGLINEFEIDKVRTELEKHGGENVWIVLMVDSQQAYKHLEKIIPHVDAVLIARLDLALYLEPATVPMITKEIIQICNDRFKMVFLASEMLASMRFNPTPTRAEVSDVANAVLDGTDATVISEEVSYGKHSLRAVDMMQKVIQDVEKHTEVRANWLKRTPLITREMDAISYTAYRTAERLNAKAIVCITKEGVTAVKLASFRPPIPIIAVTFNQKVLQRLAVVRGVSSIVLDINPNIDEVLPVVNERLLRDSWLQSGDRIIFVSVTLSSLGTEASNLFSVQKLS